MDLPQRGGDALGVDRAEAIGPRPAERGFELIERRGERQGGTRLGQGREGRGAVGPGEGKELADLLRQAVQRAEALDQPAPGVVRALAPAPQAHAGQVAWRGGPPARGD